jgi:hypothetical protein
MDIELATNKELIDELLSRKTFCGAVIFSVDEHRVVDQEHCEFGMNATFDGKEQTIKLLTLMADGLKETEF